MAPGGCTLVSMKALYAANDCGCRLCWSYTAGKGKRQAEKGAETNEVVPMI